jgi:hypothetical protein
MTNAKKYMEGLSYEERDQMKQYGESIKEIKKKMIELIHKGKSKMKEGGNMSSGLVLYDEE